ncbi:MAG TPA: hypothetical protein VGC01_06950 [Mucilaginibacter sp.]
MKSYFSVCGSLLLMVSIAFAINAYGQKLPNIQQNNLRAPANIKVDGKATEWDNKFQAYNKATDVFYTLSNDDKNLYLTIQAIDRDVIHKIINGRLAFYVNKGNSKTLDSAISVRYPIFDRKDKPELRYREKPTSVKEADSIMLINNKRFEEKSKWIRVTGVAGLDTLISVYNEDGIKAFGSFDKNMIYTCEFAFSLKTLGLSIEQQPTMFNYTLQLNAISVDNLPGVSVTRDDHGTITRIDVLRPEPLLGSITGNTNFRGEYTLAKK